MLLSFNPVNAVFFFIITFFISSVNFILLNGDIIGIFILIIYIGAIAVLFLFIVMLINIKNVEKDATTYVLLGSFFFFIFVVQTIYMIIYFFFDSNYTFEIHSYEFSTFSSLDETNKDQILNYIGQYIFTKHPIFLLYSGLILIVGMISSIFLTNLKSSLSFRKQYSQLSRNESLYILHLY
jgi:NADH-quinone oxidoreductase subunit J